MTDRIGFIFDMDGVIVDSTAAHTEAWIIYLKRHGIEIDGIHARMLGKHNDEIVRDFFEGVELTDDEILYHGASKEALYREIMAPALIKNLVPGVADFIRNHCNAPMAVASNAEPANVDFVLDAARIRDCFQAVVNGHDVKRPKPYPDVFLRAAELLRIDPANCIVFEDSETGVRAARAAGMRVVGLLTTLPRFDNVDLVIKDFCEPELERWLCSARAGATDPLIRA